MTAARERFAVTAGLTALVALAALSATTLGAAARRMPLVVALPTLVLLIVELTRQMRAPHPQDEDQPERRAEIATLAWLGVLVVEVWLLGMLAGLPLFLVTYLRLRSREPWTVAVGMALGVWAILFGVLNVALGIQMHDGLLVPLLGHT